MDVFWRSRFQPHYVGRVLSALNTLVEGLFVKLGFSVVALNVTVALLPVIGLKHVSVTLCLPGCIMRPAAIFVNYIYTIKITQ